MPTMVQPVNSGLIEAHRRYLLNSWSENLYKGIWINRIVKIVFSLNLFAFWVFKLRGITCKESLFSDLTKKLSPDVESLQTLLSVPVLLPVFSTTGLCLQTILVPERLNRLLSGSFWASASLNRCWGEPTVSQIVGNVGLLEKVREYGHDGKDSKGTESLVFDFTVYIHIMLVLWTLSCVQRVCIALPP